MTSTNCSEVSIINNSKLICKKEKVSIRHASTYNNEQLIIMKTFSQTHCCMYVHDVHILIGAIIKTTVVFGMYEKCVNNVNITPINYTV